MYLASLEYKLFIGRGLVSFVHHCNPTPENSTWHRVFNKYLLNEQMDKHINHPWPGRRYMNYQYENTQKDTECH